VWNRFFAGLLLFLTFCAWLPMARDSEQIPVKAEQIPLYDAEILIYLLPQAHEIRKEGMDIGWELQTSPKLNQEDFYTFWVINAKRKHVNGSVTVGYFSVNKHTADIVDNLGELVTSLELAGVQRILREGHHIDTATIQRYRSRNPHAPSRPG
jgi:hypothetical protein